MPRGSTSLVLAMLLVGCANGPTPTPAPTSISASMSGAPPATESSSPTVSTPSASEADETHGAAGLAFVRRDETLFGQVYVVDEGGATRQLTQLDPTIHTGGAQSVAWSPDGERLAFAYGPSVTAGLGIIDADGGEALMVAGGFYAWSPDGSRLATGEMLDVAPPEAMNSLVVRVVNPRTGEAEEVGRGVLRGWHPDGERIVVVRARGASDSSPGVPQLVLVSTVDGTETDLLPGALEARWSPDGIRVAYALEEPECGPSCSRILIDSAGASQTIEIDNGVDPVWSADGRRLAYFAFGGVAAELKVVDLVTGETIGLGPATHPIAWSPEGHIATAAHSDELGQMVIRIFDVESGQLVAAVPGQAPSWRPVMDGP